MKRLLVALLVLLPSLAHGATLYYLTNDASDISGWKKFARSAGSGVVTSTTSTGAGGNGALGGTCSGGTNDGGTCQLASSCPGGGVCTGGFVQLTDTNGGTPLKWLSDPINSVTMTGSESFNWRDAKEEAGTVNARLTCTVSIWRYNTQALETGADFSFDMASELTTSYASYSDNTTPFWQPAYNNGDRIAVICFADDAPSVTMQASKEVYLRFNQTSTSTLVQFAETFGTAVPTPTATATGGATATPTPTPTATVTVTPTATPVVQVFVGGDE